ncbi:unnamed protein product [Pleuronectes platessa]|uniref:Integrase core domain-containing protein n=1 Tax=Pleuronectes platessa TaxID=8262 RepID=A0A9N7YUS6_PLEPL|nr:unnamed protein product [Pleuronectes platessa]
MTFGFFFPEPSSDWHGIERLWRDLWVAVTSIYYDVLHYLEEEGFLSIDNITHLFCCHFVFLPRLQDDLDTFRSGWDNHPIRTESQMTPNQLWMLGRAHHPIPEPEDMDIPDIDPNSPIPNLTVSMSSIPNSPISNFPIPNFTISSPSSPILISPISNFPIPNLTISSPNSPILISPISNFPIPNLTISSPNSPILISPISNLIKSKPSSPKYVRYFLIVFLSESMSQPE